MPASTSDLYTTVRNVSGVEMTFSYLGKHGKKLSANGSMTVFGHIQHSFGHGEQAVRKARALERDLLNGRLEILSTPRPILRDADPDPAVANPTTQATVAATGGGASGGLLAAGKYKVAYTFVNEWGETTVGSSASAEFTVSAGNVPRVTLPSLPSFADSMNVYVTATGVSSADVTTLRLYQSDVEAGTLDLSGALPTLDDDNPAPPTSNTTIGREPRALASTGNELGTVDPSWVA